MTTEYKGWAIHWCPNRRGYEAIGPNYEPTWLGEADGWQDDYEQRTEAQHFAEIIAEIDARIEEEAEYQAACAADAELERQWEETPP